MFTIWLINFDVNGMCIFACTIPIRYCHSWFPWHVRQQLTQPETRWRVCLWGSYPQGIQGRHVGHPVRFILATLSYGYISLRLCQTSLQHKKCKRLSTMKCVKIAMALTLVHQHAPRMWMSFQESWPSVYNLFHETTATQHIQKETESGHLELEKKVLIEISNNWCIVNVYVLC